MGTLEPAESDERKWLSPVVPERTGSTSSVLLHLPTGTFVPMPFRNKLVLSLHPLFLSWGFIL